jgi:hypothetical protein
MQLRPHLVFAVKAGLAAVVWAIVLRGAKRLLGHQSGDPIRTEAIVALLLGAAVTLGVFLYRLLRAWFERRGRRARRGRVGALAGALTALPFTVLYLRRTPHPGEFGHGEFLVFVVGAAAVFGALLARWAPLARSGRPRRRAT